MTSRACRVHRVHRVQGGELSALLLLIGGYDDHGRLGFLCELPDVARRSHRANKIDGVPVLLFKQRLQAEARHLRLSRLDKQHRGFHRRVPPSWPGYWVGESEGCHAPSHNYVPKRVRNGTGKSGLGLRQRARMAYGTHKGLRRRAVKGGDRWHDTADTEASPIPWGSREGRGEGRPRSSRAPGAATRRRGPPSRRMPTSSDGLPTDLWRRSRAGRRSGAGIAGGGARPHRDVARRR